MNDTVAGKGILLCSKICTAYLQGGQFSWEMEYLSQLLLLIDILFISMLLIVFSIVNISIWWYLNITCSNVTKRTSSWQVLDM